MKKFDKPDVFTNATILQFFTNKDNETMKFIQDKFSKTTILQKTLSNNKGDQHQKNQVWGGSTSVGEGESVNSGGVEMVHFDQIREMPKDEQWFLVDNNRPIKAKKLPYYADNFFDGCLVDPNPIEDKNFSKKIARFMKLQEQKIVKDAIDIQQLNEVKAVDSQIETIIITDEKIEASCDSKPEKEPKNDTVAEETSILELVEEPTKQIENKEEVPF